MKRIKKKPANFRLAADIVNNLEAASKAAGVDKTQILEMALEMYLIAALDKKAAQVAHAAAEARKRQAKGK
jgi:DNA-binding ferritin-like protein (Dps family)